jgi:circadian clock protein KaiC
LAFEYGAERRRLCVTKIRGVRYRGGYHDYTIRTGGLVVFPRLVAAEHHAPFVHVNVSSGVPELDTLLGAGLDQGTSTLIVGPAGSGKTVLASQYACAAARRGDKVAVYLFDERLGTFLARSNRLGMDLERHMRDGRIRVRQLDPAEISPSEFAHMVVHSTQHEGTGFVVIDSLNGYITAIPEERLVNIRLHELLSYLAQRGVTTLLTLAQHGVFSETAGDQPEVSYYIADTLILLRFFEAAGEVRKTISVLKKRSGHHEQTIREFQITDQGVRVGQPLREFQGVLTGVPTYIGEPQPLLPPDPI